MGTIDDFHDVMTGKKKSVADWKKQLNADRDKQRGSSGVYNPKSGEREYGGFHRGPKKDMHGRRYRG